jgi:hypothetical protein
MATQNHVTELYPPNWKPQRGWRQIAEEASTEQDGAKLLKLTDELLEALCKDDD